MGDSEDVLANITRLAQETRKRVREPETTRPNSRDKREPFKIPRYSNNIGGRSVYDDASDEGPTDLSAQARMNKRIKNLEEQLEKYQKKEEADYKKKYEDLLYRQSSSFPSTIIPVEPGVEDSLVKGVWTADGKEPAKVEDDSHKKLGLMSLRLSLFPPNHPAAK